LTADTPLPPTTVEILSQQTYGINDNILTTTSKTRLPRRKQRIVNTFRRRPVRLGILENHQNDLNQVKISTSYYRVAVLLGGITDLARLSVFMSIRPSVP